ncbi:hypothetical protein ACROYT_G026836 [Oculina patagonica]
MGSGNENEVSRVGEATKYLNGAFTFQSLRRIGLRSSYCISKFKRITSTVSTMRERRKSQENDKRRRKSKPRRLSVTCKRDSTCRKTVEEESMDIDACSLSNEEPPNSQKAKEPRTDKSKTSVYTTLRANNRALAASLEDAQLELRLVRSENVQLKKQFSNSHQLFVEKTSELQRQLQSQEQLSQNNMPKAAQAIFHDVYKLLNQTCAQFLQGSQSLSDAIHLVDSLLTPSKGQKHTSPHVVYNNVSPYVDPASIAVCTTPPPDQPSAMEITATQSIIIETNDTIMKNLDRGLEKNLSFSSEQKNIDGKVENNKKAMQVSQSQLASQRAKRKSCSNISYVEPGLRSKLRRGDPFTDSTLFGEESQINKRKRKKSLPVMGGTRKRAPLSNLTNIIAEES